MPEESEVIRFPQLTQMIECAFDGKTQFLCASLDDAIAKCVARARSTNGKTSVSLKITFDPTRGESRILVTAQVGTQIPEPGSFPLLAFVDRMDRLVPEDPRQTTLVFTKPEAVEEGS